MYQFSVWVLFVAALIPLVVGFIWFNEKTFAPAWIKASGVDVEKSKKANPLIVFGLTYLLSVFLTVPISALVIHQIHLGSILMNEPGLNDSTSEIGKFFTDFMAKYGTNFRTFKHGAFHGTLAALFFALPVIGIISLFENRSFKYVLIHAGYWLVTLVLMGGVICAWA